jgi:WD40 repeat protein
MKNCQYIVLGLIMSLCFLSENFAQTPELMFPATHQATSVVFSPDDKWVISTDENMLKIWDNESGRLMKNIVFNDKNSDAYYGPNIIMTVSPDSKLLAIKRNDSLYFFNFDHFSFEKKVPLKDHVEQFTFSLDSKTLYCAGKEYGKENDILIHKVSVADGVVTILQKYLIKIEGMRHTIRKLTISPDGSQLLVYDAGIGSRLLDINANKFLNIFEKDVFPYTFLPNGNFVAYGGEKHETFLIEELEAKTYKVLRKTPVIFKRSKDESLFFPVSFPSISGKIALECNESAVLFDAKTFTFNKKNLFNKVSQPKDVSIAPSGKYYIIAESMSRYDLKTGEIQWKYGFSPALPKIRFPLQHTEGVWVDNCILTFKKGGFKRKRFKNACADCDFTVRLTKDGSKGFVIGADGALSSFDPNAKDLEYKTIESVPQEGLMGLRLIEPWGWLVVVDNQGAYVVDMKTLKLKTQLKKPKKGGEYVLREMRGKYYSDISPDKTKLILYGGSENGDTDADTVPTHFIYCYDLATKSLIWTYSTQTWDISDIRFSDNGKKVAFISSHNLSELETANGKLIGIPQNVMGAELNDVAETRLSPSGKYIVSDISTGSWLTRVVGGIDVFDVTTKKHEQIMKGSGKGLTFLKDERYLLTEEEGGLVILDLVKKRQVAKILLFEDSDDWLVMTPDGRFDASPETMKKMYFMKGKEVIPLESLYEKFYVPNLLNQVWESDLKLNSLDIKNIKSPPSVKISVENKQRNLNVEDDGKKPSYIIDNEQVNIKVQADCPSDMVTEIRLFQNGKLIGSTRNLTVEDEKNTGEKSMLKTFSIVLNAGDNNFKAIAFNSQRTESQADEIIVNYKAAKASSPSEVGGVTLHLLVIGLNNYKNPKHNLNYATADAVSFKEAIEKGSTSIFSKTNIVFLGDAQATKEGISTALDKIKTTAKPKDVFIFYYAGHGVMNEKKDFYLVPYDVIQMYGQDDALAQKGLSANELQQFSRDIKAQKQLFILDACQSAGALETLGAARGAAEEKAIAQLARATGTHWLTASGSEQSAAEFPQLGHGTFTYVLLEALSGKADNGGDKKITVKELDAYLQEQVPEMTAKYRGTPQYPSSYGYGNDFPIGVVKN